MIKVAEIVKRRAGMGVEEFQAHWRDHHGPIVAKLPGLRRYVQSHPLPGGYRRGELPYDGVAELWFDSKDTLAAVGTTAAFADAKADEPNFIDTAQLLELVLDEHVIKDGTPPDGAIKSIIAVRFDPAMEPAEAGRYWREVHGPLAAEMAQITRYVQSHVRPGAYRGGRRPQWDGLAVTWFESIEVMRESARTERYREVIEDDANFLATDVQMPVLLTREHVVIG
jgi:uncharacterized protein (TIGR02118 family)